MDPETLQRRIDAAPDLPTLDEVVIRIQQMIRDPRTSAQDVGDMIAQDPALSAKVLRLVNSAFYGFPGEIKSVTRAIVILGFNKIRNLAVTASVFDRLTVEDAAGFDVRAFWEHSIGVAVMSEVIAADLRLDHHEDAFVCGLLHDVGKIFEAVVMPDEFAEVMEKVEADGCLMVEAEADVLGVDHALVGARLAEKWNFPERLVTPIRRHHAPARVREDAALTQVVHVADILVRAMEVGSGGDARIPAVDQTAWEDLEIDAGVLDAWLGQFRSSLRRADAFFELIQ